MNKSMMRIMGGVIMGLILTLALPLEVRAQEAEIHEHWPSADYDYPVINEGGALEVKMEYWACCRQNADEIHACAGLKVWLEYDALGLVAGNLDLVDIHALSEVVQGDSTNSLTVDVLGSDFDLDCEVDGNIVTFSEATPVFDYNDGFTFPIWGPISVDIDFGFGVGFTPSISLGLGGGGAGVSGSFQAWANCYVSAGLLVGLDGIAWVEVGVAAECTILDYTLTATGTISFLGVFLEVSQEMVGLSVDVWAYIEWSVGDEIKIFGVTINLTLWSGYETIDLWSFSMGGFQEQLYYHEEFWENDNTDTERPIRPLHPVSYPKKRVRK